MGRISNCIIAIIGAVFLLPIMLVIALIIRLDSPGPIIFRQKRIGLHGQDFIIYKFRTMKVGTPDIPAEYISSTDSRFTRVGKILRRFSLDELPQLINILKGDMEIVGPRPALYNQEELIKKRMQNGVYDVKPGITGWAQINGRDNISNDEKVQLDTYYARNKNFFFDLKIIILTIWAVISGKDTYRDNQYIKCSDQHSKGIGG